MAELVVGVDGGNSKTDLVLADTDGRILVRVSGAGTLCYADGIEATIADIMDLLQRARAEARIPAGTPIGAAAYFLANIDLPEDEEAATTVLNRHAQSAENVVHNDTFAVLHSGAPEGWGIAVVSGAGINATGVHADGRIARFLALGEVSGDWGGGQGVAVAGLGLAVRAGDGRGPATVLRDLVAAPFGLESAEELALAITANRIDESRLLVLAPVVFAAAQDGDAVALSIVHRLADEIVTMVAALLRRLDLTDEAIPVVFGGGTLQYGPPVLLERVTEGIRAIAPNARFRLLDVPPVAGAVLHAMSLLGANAQAKRRAREALKDERFSTLSVPLGAET
ncbi:MAG: BadF/BadG/BcrA/BcrD ATPase family protein [Actinomycetota bacterium]